MNKSESKYFQTSQKMMDALLSLLETKDFDYISIKDICSLTKINRSTFYLHYENTYELLVDSLKSLNQSFTEHFNNTPRFDLKKKDSLFLITDEYLTPYLDFVEKNKKAYKAIKNHPEIFNVSSSYSQMYEKVFSPILDTYGVKDEVEKRYTMDYYVNGISSILADWIKDDCTYPKDKLIDLIKRQINGKRD